MTSIKFRTIYILLLRLWYNDTGMKHKFNYYWSYLSSSTKLYSAVLVIGKVFLRWDSSMLGKLASHTVVATTVVKTVVAQTIQPTTSTRKWEFWNKVFFSSMNHNNWITRSLLYFCTLSFCLDFLAFHNYRRHFFAIYWPQTEWEMCIIL
jgi:uncharacterized membrane protein